MTPTPTPSRGDVWDIRFDPSIGDEISKVRPAVVLSENAIGRLKLKIVVPITDWKPRYTNCPWFVYLAHSSANGLTKESGADAFQVKSVSLTRFIKHRGVVTAGELQAIADAIAICVGAS